MTQERTGGFAIAREDFSRVRQQARIQQVLARFTNRPQELLPYEDVRRALRAEQQIERGLRDIPLDAIIGSVGRYNDFTRDFLPKSDSMVSRWAAVKQVATSLTGWPPIDVYQIGDAYFVLDGNHRVSVAREMGLTHIDAYVTEIQTNIPLSPDTDLDDLICKARYAEFLERTKIDELRSDVNLTVTAPGAYRLLDEHISVHQYYMGLEKQRDISLAEAVSSWYDYVYRPVAQMICEHGILRDFPDRTETDLYLWLAEHRAEMEEAIGWEITKEEAADDLVQQHGQSRERVLNRVGQKVLDAIVPDPLESGPPPGEWRRQRESRLNDPCLFADLLVTVTGEEVSWFALQQAMVIARREGSRLRGLHVTAPETDWSEPHVQYLQARFSEMCTEEGFAGHLHLSKSSQVPRAILDKARWVNLVVMNMQYPPGKKAVERLGSGFRAIIQQSPRPILMTPGVVSPLKKALLAYDGRSKSQEALYLATYLCGQWQIPLVVVTAVDANEEGEVIEKARAYLENHGVTAEYVVQEGPSAEVILATAVAYQCDFLIMGGYNASPIRQVILGSVADTILRRSTVPIFICN